MDHDLGGQERLQVQTEARCDSTFVERQDVAMLTAVPCESTTVKRGAVAEGGDEQRALA